MAQFSEADINAAKRRVQEMRNRASRFTGEETPQPEPKREQTSRIKNKNTENPALSEKSDEKSDEEQDKSFFIILALIMLLSKEGADNTLIMALLYLLL